MSTAANGQADTETVDPASTYLLDFSDRISSHGLAARLADEQQTETHEDLNPRSPKRRRLSQDQGDTAIDFEAAAARALAISLGIDQTSASPTPPASTDRSDTSNHARSSQPPSTDRPLDNQSHLEKLPILEDLASQILSMLAKMSHLEIGEMLFGPPSQRGKDYRNLKAKFEQVKRIYLTNSPFISPAAFDLKAAAHIDALRKVNMATFMASIFSGEIGLRIMDINFLDVFVPEGGRLLKAQASIYLELKTQAFIAAKRTAPAMLNQVMLDLFPDNMEKCLLLKRLGAKSLAPSESDFLKRLASRRDILYADMRSQKLDNLELRYRWDDFSREVSSYLTKNHDPATLGSRDKTDLAPHHPIQAPLQQNQMEGRFSIMAEQSQQQQAIAGLPASSDPDLNLDMDDFVAQAARAAGLALQGESYTNCIAVSSVPPQSPQLTEPAPASELPATVVATAPVHQTDVPTVLGSQLSNPTTMSSEQTEFQSYQPPLSEKTSVANVPAVNEAKDTVPHRSQTAPTQVLYERARLVTTNKASPSTRKPNAPSHRRPWTSEEENALMTGLDQVKGPHWSQILAMYGPGGTINESLKDRNQVQLKDKARNLKLFFLKAGIEVPYYLQAVTGDLKTRAPGQAEKREAKERERVNIEEDDVSMEQDDSQIDATDGVDLRLQSAAEKEERRGTPPAMVNGTQNRDSDKHAVQAEKSEDAFDLEAMIARATASATRVMENL